MLVACYGSLKEGFYNHRVLGEDAEFLGKSLVQGVMYWNGSYPKLYKPYTPVEEYGDRPANLLAIEHKNARDHELEIYRVSEKAFDHINAMELGAGYVAEEIETEWGPATIYWMPHENFSDTDKWIAGYTKELFDK